MSKKTGKPWTDSDNVIKLLSIGVAIIAWVVVSINISPYVPKTFVAVPVDVEVQAAAFSELGLNVIEVSPATVSVKVVGTRVAVGQLTEESLMATPQISSVVTDPNTYDLRLVPVNTIDKDISSIIYSPDYVQVKVDRLRNATFRVTPVINGMVTSPDDSYVQGRESVYPSQVTVTGPQAEIDKIKWVTVQLDLNEPLEKTYAAELSILFLDEQGEEIDLESSGLTASAEEARLVIEVLKTTGLPLEVRFTNVPKNFPIGSLTYTMDYDHVEVAGPVDSIGRELEIILGYIDLRTVNTDRDAFTFDVELPEDFQNLNGVTRSTVTFDSEDWEEMSFRVDDFQLINIPPGYEVNLSSDTTLSSVNFVGRADILESMSADDIVAEVDLSERDISAGQTQFPVKISVPNKGLVWATGEHTIVIQITELNEDE